MNRKNITTFYHILTFLLLTLLLWSCNPGTSTSNAARGELGDDLALSIQFIPASEPSQAQTVPAQRSTTANDFMAIFSGVREAGHFIVSPSSPSASYYVFAAEVAGQIDTAEAIKNLILDEADPRVLARNDQTGQIALPDGMSSITLIILVASEAITVDTDTSTLNFVTFQLTAAFASSAALTELQLSYYGKNLIPTEGDGSFSPQTTEYTTSHIDYGSGTDYDAYVITTLPEQGITLTSNFNEVDSSTRTLTLIVTNSDNTDETITYAIAISLTPRPTTETLNDLITASNVTVNAQDQALTEANPNTNLKTFTASYTGDSFLGTSMLSLTTNDLTGTATIAPIDGVASFASDGSAAQETLTVTLTEDINRAEYPNLPTGFAPRTVTYSLTIDLAQINPATLTDLQLSYYGKDLIPTDGGVSFSPQTAQYTTSHIDYGSGVGYDAYVTNASPLTGTAVTSSRFDDVDSATRTLTLTVSDNDPTDGTDYDETVYTVTISVTPRPTVNDIISLVTATNVLIARQAQPLMFNETGVGDTRNFSSTYEGVSFIGSSVLQTVISPLPSTVTIDPEDGVASFESDGNAIQQAIVVTLSENTAEYSSLPSSFTPRRVIYTLNINLTNQVANLTDLQLSYYGKDLIPTDGDGSFSPQTTEYTTSHIDYGSGTGHDAYVTNASLSTGTAVTFSEFIDDVDSATRTLTLTVSDDDPTDGIDYDEIVYTITISLTPRPTVAELSALITGTNVTINQMAPSQAITFTESLRTDQRIVFFATYSSVSFTGDTVLALTTNDPAGKADIFPLDGRVVFTSDGSAVANQSISVLLTEVATPEYTLPDRFSLRSITHLLSLSLNEMTAPTITQNALSVTSAGSTPTITYDDSGQTFTVTGLTNYPAATGTATTSTFTIPQGYEFVMSSDYTIDQINPLEATATFADPTGSGAVANAALATFTVRQVNNNTDYTYTVSGNFLGESEPSVTRTNFTVTLDRSVPIITLDSTPPSDPATNKNFIVSGLTNRQPGGDITVTFTPPTGYSLTLGRSPDTLRDLPGKAAMPRAFTLPFTIVQTGTTTPTYTYSLTINLAGEAVPDPTLTVTYDGAAYPATLSGTTFVIDDNLTNKNGASGSIALGQLPAGFEYDPATTLIAFDSPTGNDAAPNHTLTTFTAREINYNANSETYTVVANFVEQPSIHADLNLLSVSYYGKELIQNFDPQTLQYSASHTNYGIGTRGDAYMINADSRPGLTIRTNLSDSALTMTVMDSDSTDEYNYTSTVYTLTLSLIPRITPSGLANLVTRPDVTVNGQSQFLSFTTSDSDVDTQTFSATYPGEAFDGTSVLQITTQRDLTDIAMLTPLGGMASFTSVADIAQTGEITVTLTEVIDTREYSSFPAAKTRRSVNYTLTLDLILFATVSQANFSVNLEGSVSTIAEDPNTSDAFIASGLTNRANRDITVTFRPHRGFSLDASSPASVTVSDPDGDGVTQVASVIDVSFTIVRTGTTTPTYTYTLTGGLEAQQTVPEPVIASPLYYQGREVALSRSGTTFTVAEDITNREGGVGIILLSPLADGFEYFNTRPISILFHSPDGTGAATDELLSEFQVREIAFHENTVTYSIRANYLEQDTLPPGESIVVSASYNSGNTITLPLNGNVFSFPDPLTSRDGVTGTISLAPLPAGFEYDPATTPITFSPPAGGVAEYNRVLHTFSIREVAFTGNSQTYTITAEFVSSRGVSAPKPVPLTSLSVSYYGKELIENFSTGSYRYLNTHTNYGLGTDYDPYLVVPGGVPSGVVANWNFRTFGIKTLLFTLTLTDSNPADLDTYEETIFYLTIRHIDRATKADLAALVVSTNVTINGADIIIPFTKMETALNIDTFVASYTTRTFTGTSTLTITTNANTIAKLFPLSGMDTSMSAGSAGVKNLAMTVSEVIDYIEYSNLPAIPIRVIKYELFLYLLNSDFIEVTQANFNITYSGQIASIGMNRASTTPIADIAVPVSGLTNQVGDADAFIMTFTAPTGYQFVTSTSYTIDPNNPAQATIGPTNIEGNGPANKAFLFTAEQPGVANSQIKYLVLVDFAAVDISTALGTPRFTYGSVDYDAPVRMMGNAIHNNEDHIIYTFGTESEPIPAQADGTSFSFEFPDGTMDSSFTITIDYNYNSGVIPSSFLLNNANKTDRITTRTVSYTHMGGVVSQVYDFIVVFGPRLP